MRIVIIHGQNHMGSTYHVARLLLEQIHCEKKIDEFFLPRDLSHFCTGCYNCLDDETKCPHYAQKYAIMQKVEKADVLILTSPNYCMAPSAPMKSFIDLTFTYWMSHKPRAAMFHKRAIVLSTTAGMGTKYAIKPIKRTLFYWGIPWVKSYGIAVQAKNWNGVSEKKSKKIKKDMEKLAQNLTKSYIKNKKPNATIKIKLMFNMMAKMQKEGLGSGPVEREYWEKQGWLERNRPWKQE